MASLTLANIDYYLAGVFDGEGTIGVYHRSWRGTDGPTRIIVAVAMCDKPPLKAFHERFGGRLRLDRVIPSGRHLWKWYRVGTSAKEALTVFAELCLNKGPQAKLALEAIALVEATRGRDRRHRITPVEENRRAEIAAEVKRLKSENL